MMVFGIFEKRIILLSIILICSMVANLIAAGTSSAAFLGIGWGARPAAMGEAFTAAAADIEALYWNPAGLTGVKRLQESFGYNSWIQGIKVGNASFASRRSKYSVIGGGVGYAHIGDIKKGDKYGNDVGAYSASDIVFVFSYARMWKPGFSLGGNFKVVKERIANASAQGFALDAGAVYRLNAKTKLGATIKNLGTGMTFSKESAPMPLGLRLGGARQFTKKILLLTF